MPIRPPVHRPAHLPTPREARDAYDRFRGSPPSRGYDRAWRRLRDQVLREEPLCRACLAAGRVTEAVMVHHVEPVAARPDLRLTRSNLGPLCDPHHAAEHAGDR